MSRDVPELWKLYTTEVQKMVLPWFSSLKETHGHLGDAMSGDRYAALKTYNVFMDTFQSTLGKFGAAPAIGYTREFQEKLTKAFETWGEVRRAEAGFQTELVNAGFRALEDMIRTLVEMGEKGEKIKGSRQLFDLWVATAEKVFSEIASTESFAEIQGRLVNAAMQYRVCERDLAEEWLKSLHLPTRHELDDAYKHMYQMRREVKALRRELDELRQERKTAEPAPTTSQGGRRPKRGTREGTAAGASAPPAASQP
jgi:class III poly(R)-hydroxyalkanoic acid synthase PhaE subunit